jgi:hypothetical protein
VPRALPVEVQRTKLPATSPALRNNVLSSQPECVKPPARRNGDPGNVRIARRLRQETTMTPAWIATRLQMGTWTNVPNLLRST